MKTIVGIWLIFAPLLWGEGFIRPAPPTFEQPRKIVLQLSSTDEKLSGRLVSYINNIQKAYGTGLVSIAVIAQADGLVYLSRNSPLRDRIDALIQSDVEFIACENTMETKNLTSTDMMSDISYTRSGMQEIVERQIAGWIYLVP
jgi:uncharacterized protein